MLITVAFVVGSVVEMMNRYRDELEVQTHNLAEVNDRRNFPSRLLRMPTGKL